MTTLDAEACERQAKALAQAANDSPVPQISQPLRIQAREWKNASQDLRAAAELEIQAEVCLAGAVMPGMTLVLGGREKELIRILDQGGRLALHVTDNEDGREQYHNLYGGRAAPVLIRVG